MRKQPLLYRHNEIISRYHEITVHEKEEKSMAILGFRNCLICASIIFIYTKHHAAKDF